jgi:hypothetical protein
MILDADGNRISSLALAAAPGSDNAFTLRIQCRAGYFLSAVNDDDVTITGKANPGDAFQNLQSSPIDLIPYDGTVRVFYFNAAIDSGATAETVVPQIIVSP